MTAAPAIEPADSRPARGPLSVAAIAVLATVAVLTLLALGVSFFALAIAFPIALAVAPQFPLFVKPAELAIAEAFAGLWPAFAALSVVSLVAAGVVVVKAVEAMDARRAA